MGRLDLLKSIKKGLEAKINNGINLVKELKQAKKYTKELKSSKEQLDVIEEVAETKFSKEVKKAIETIKGTTKAEFKGIVDASFDLEKQIGDLKLQASGKSKNEGNVKIELDTKSLLLLNGLKVLMEAGFISTNDFSLSASVEEEFGDLKATLKSELKGLAKVQAKLSASVTVLDIRNGVLLDVLVKAEAGFELNITGTVNGELSLKDDLKLTASVTGEVNIKGDAVAEGEVKMTVKAVSVRGKAGAKAEASATAKAIIGAFAFSDILGVELEGGVKGEAKAEASATGEFTVDVEKGTIAIGGKVTALASVGAKAYLCPNLLLKGERVLSLDGSIGVSAGYGGQAGGTFQIEDGKLLIYVDIGAALKGGVESEVTLTIDLKTIATIIKTAVQEKYSEWSDVKVKDGKVYIKLTNDDFDTPIAEDAEGEILKNAIAKQRKEVAKTIEKYRLNKKKEDKVKAKKSAIKKLDSVIVKAIAEVRHSQTHFTAKRLAEDKTASDLVDRVLSDSLTKLINTIENENKSDHKEVEVKVKNQKITALEGWNLTKDNGVIY